MLTDGVVWIHALGGVDMLWSYARQLTLPVAFFTHVNWVPKTVLGQPYSMLGGTCSCDGLASNQAEAVLNT